MKNQQTNKKVKMAMAQLLVEGGEPMRNIDRALQLITEASQQGCDIVLLPETIDFGWTHPSALTESESIPGKFSQPFSDAAKKLGIYICVGLTEKLSDTERYNSAILIDNKGETILNYHKINLLSVEQPYYNVGTSLSVVDTPFGKIGVNICADNYMDALHLGHSLARMGAQIILSPSSWTVDHSITEADEPYREKWIKPLKTLASLYNLIAVSTTSVGYIVGGPYEGKKMVGCSLLVNKEGIVSQGQMNEFAGELIVAEVIVPERPEQGTEIGEMLKNKGYNLEK